MEFQNLTIFKIEKSEEESEVEIEVVIVSDDIEIDEDEAAALRLPPKFSGLEDLNEEGFRVELEKCYAKLRWDIKKATEEKVEGEVEEKNDEEKEIQDKIEAESRQVFNPIEKSLDYTKRRVTDLKENAKIHLPKPLEVKEESKIELRREIHTNVFRDFVQKECKEGRGEEWNQKTNFTTKERRGIKKLKARIKNKEIVILQTDKSGKLAVASMKNYIKWARCTLAKMKRWIPKQ